MPMNVTDVTKKEVFWMGLFFVEKARLVTP
jgi:hypothetical protein